MAKPDDREWLALLEDHDSFTELAAFLVANSRLPGPRANLGLAKAFADEAGRLGIDNARWRLLHEWTAISAAEAPTGDPREFLPFCALQALGALYANASPAQRDDIVALVRAAAEDPRWRTRESVAIALQRLGLTHPADLMTIVDAWLPEATLLGQRAIIAALAEPPLLRDPHTAHYALEVADRIMDHVHGQDRATRQTEPFRVLRQALEYALSVIVAAAPDPGFAQLRAWAAIDDADFKRIVRANLGKNRLKKLRGVIGDG